MKKNIEKYDVLLTYEIRNREIENLCLLKWELERRGYTVGIRRQYACFFRQDEPVDAKVVVVPGLYRERALFYSATHTFKTSKIINMVNEQVFSAALEDKKDVYFSIKPWAYKAAHIAWGYNMRDRMINQWGVPENHVFLTGHVSLDFLRPQLKKYYMGREELFRKYSINSEARVHMFVSSFAWADMDAAVYKSATTDGDTSYVSELAQIVRDTRDKILDWFQNVLRENPDDVIIYRPHPEENRNYKKLKQLEDEYKNFKIISEESIKQWFVTCDRIYLWSTTSIAEAYAAGKKVLVLRPIEVPVKMNYKVYDSMKYVTDYRGFKRAFKDCGYDEFIDKNKISEYWYIDNEKLSYQKVCDMIEHVLINDDFCFEPALENPFLKKGINIEKIKNVIKRIIADSKMMESLHNSSFLKKTKFRELLDNVFYVKYKFEKNYVSSEEIDEIMKKINYTMTQEGL